MADRPIAFQRPSSSRSLNWTTDQPYLSIFKTTFPNQTFHFMAGGRPTVLGIDGVIREVFVQPGDAAALAEAVRRLAANPDLRKRQGEKACAYVIQHFDRRQQAVQFVDLLEGFRDAAA